MSGVELVVNQFPNRNRVDRDVYIGSQHFAQLSLVEHGKPMNLGYQFGF